MTTKGNPLLKCVAYLSKSSPSDAVAIADIVRVLRSMLEPTEVKFWFTHANKAIARPRRMSLQSCASDISKVVTSKEPPLIELCEINKFNRVGLYYNSSREFQFGMQHSPTLSIAVFPRALKKNKKSAGQALAKIASSFFKVIDVHGIAFSGVAHLDDSERAEYGSYYDISFVGNMPWKEAVEYVRWLSINNSLQHRVRGPAWGTYLGRNLVAQCDPAGKLGSEFLAERGEPCSHRLETYPGGGRAFFVCSDPLELVEEIVDRPNTGAVLNAVWLLERFRSAGVL